jgi:signal transduction histidine kinase
MARAKAPKPKKTSSGTPPDSPARREEALRGAVARLRSDREAIRAAWAAELHRRGLGKSLTAAETDVESARIFDALVTCLETGRYHSAQAYAQDMAERDVFRGIGAKHVIGRLLVLRDVCARSVSARRRGAAAPLDSYEPVVNRMLTIVAMAFLQERDRAVGRGQEQLGALVEAGMALAAERSLDAVLQRIVEIACRLLRARYGALGTLEADGRLGRFVTTGMTEEERARLGALPTGAGILGVVVRERKPLRLTNLMRDPRACGFPPAHPPMRSFLGVPIVSKGRVFGNLYVTEKQGAVEFSREDEQLAVTLAAQAAVAIENANLYDELRRSLEELTQSQTLLVRQEKLASLGRMAAGVAHELNNPLSAVGGFAEALQRHAACGECGGPGRFADCQEYLGMIQAEVGRAAAIVRRLLDFARQRPPTFSGVDLFRAVQDAVSFVERQASLVNRRIAVEPVPEPFEVLGDAQMLQQVFLNLLTNALDAVEGGGEVTVAIRRTATGQLVDQAIRQSGETPSPVAQSPSRPVATPVAWAEVVVADTGQGIAAEHLGKIFDPFYTTKEVGKGTGLGLAICQSIVEQHGGTVRIESPGIGRGTMATVRLPLAA